MHYTEKREMYYLEDIGEELQPRTETEKTVQKASVKKKQK